MSHVTTVHAAAQNTSWLSQGVNYLGSTRVVTAVKNVATPIFTYIGKSFGAGFTRVGATSLGATIQAHALLTSTIVISVVALAILAYSKRRWILDTVISPTRNMISELFAKAPEHPATTQTPPHPA